MAVVRIPDQDKTLTDPAEVKAHLSSLGITYERWEPSQPVSADATQEEILQAYGPEIEALKQRGGYVTADVVALDPDTPNLQDMLARFDREHWHDEDEVRFVIKGKGMFHINPQGNADGAGGSGDVVAIEVEAGDLLCVPRGTWHWFELCQTQEIRCIRLFQDPGGWTPHYTETGTDAKYQPVCLGFGDVPPQSPAAT